MINLKSKPRILTSHNLPARLVTLRAKEWNLKSLTGAGSGTGIEISLTNPSFVIKLTVAIKLTGDVNHRLDMK